MGLLYRVKKNYVMIIVKTQSLNHTVKTHPTLIPSQAHNSFIFNHKAMCAQINRAGVCNHTVTYLKL